MIMGNVPGVQMRICLVSVVTYWHGITGGMEVHGRILAKDLVAHGHEVTIITPRAWIYFLLTVLGVSKMVGGALALHSPSMRDELRSILRGAWDGLQGQKGPMVQQ